MAAIAEPLVHTMLGDKWAEAVIFCPELCAHWAFHAATRITTRRGWPWARQASSRSSERCTSPAPSAMLVLSHFLGVVGIAYAELSALLLPSPWSV